MNTLARTLAAFAVAVLCLGAAGGAAALSDADRTFMIKAAQDGLAEMELGKLAQEKGAHGKVRQLGSRMAADHGKCNADLRILARRKSVSLPSALDREHAARADELKALSGPRFDREYARGMVEEHERAVADFEEAAKGAQDADVKAFASGRLAMLRRHLKLARSTAAALGR